jgi:hypothetical protein
MEVLNLNAVAPRNSLQEDDEDEEEEEEEAKEEEEEEEEEYGSTWEM